MLLGGRGEAKGGTWGSTDHFPFPFPPLYSADASAEKELKATLSHVYRNNTTTDTRFQIMGQTQDDQVSALITDANKAK